MYMAKEKDAGDIVGSFWNNYWNADPMKRMELIDSTGCFKSMYGILTDKKMNLKTKKYVFNQRLMSYFDDLLAVMEK